VEQEHSKALTVTVILLFVAALVGPTIASALNYIGPLFLIISWMAVALAASGYYVRVLRARLKSVEDKRAAHREDDAAIGRIVNREVAEGARRKVAGSPTDAQVRDLLQQVANLQNDASKLQRDLGESEKTARDEKASRTRAERELTELKRGMSDLPRVAPEQESEANDPALEGIMRAREADQLRPQLKQVARLRKFQTPLQGKERTEFVNWRTRTGALLWEALGVDSAEASNFDDIDFEPHDILGGLLSVPSRTYAEGLDEAEAILKTAIEVYLRQPDTGKEE
jgi:hypothetical protein